MKKIVHYINQFFAGVGGESEADYRPEVIDGVKGPGLGLNTAIKTLLKAKGQDAEIVKTIICGDNFFNENEEEATAFVKKVLKDEKPDLFISGPGFNAGRYGMACGAAAKIANDMGIPAVTGLYEENPGYDLFKATMYTVQTKNSAVGMREAVPAIAKVAAAVLSGEDITDISAYGLLPRGVRKNFFQKERGAKRAVEMLVQKMNGKSFVTEYPMPIFDRVEPHAPVADISKAVVALVTSGGVVAKGNPDHIEASSASKYGEYSLKGIDDLNPSNSETAHGGYDATYCNEDADRVLPVDVLREFEKQGKIGKLFETWYSTVGNGTAVKSAKKFAAEIAKKLVAGGVQAVILTST